MRYVLSISPEEAVDRLKTHLLGPYSDARYGFGGGKPPYGYYGFVGDKGFSLGLHDSALSPRRGLPLVCIEGEVRPHPAGSEITARFCMTRLLWLFPILWLVFSISFLLGWNSVSQEERTFFILWLVGSAIAFLAWGLIFRGIRDRHFRDFQSFLSGAILETHKK